MDLASVLGCFRSPSGAPDALRCALLLAGGRLEGERLLRGALAGAVDREDAGRIAAEAVAEILGWRVWLTGAEVVAGLLAAGGVVKVFIYAGTSELALGDAVERVDGIQLVNGRGDKESAFMAAGASLLHPNRGAAILHGARGLTNAMGAVADARRSEAGTLFVVGLPSTSSARFLPPHGEPGLLDGLSGLVDWHWQAGPVPAEPEDRDREARRFVEQFRQALTFSSRAPFRPAMFGVPQDVAEQRWLPLAALVPPTPAPAGPVPAVDRAAVESAVELLARAERPLFLVDDYALRFEGFREAIDAVSAALGAPVLQVRYRRGPMLFERLRRDEVENFLGWLDSFSPVHRDLLASSDLVVTVEDRNIYERVVGALPDCRKIAVNTDPEKVFKNEYLKDKDLLVVGEPTGVLRDLADMLGRRGVPTRAPWFGPEAREPDAVVVERVDAQVRRARRAVVRTIAEVLGGWRQPVLVDDSQMFGGLLAEDYDELPKGLRVLGGHGAFVGSGLSYATGLAIADDGVRVMCTLGDQAFVNSFQGLVAAVQERARVLYVVCNNGESVSLKKQGTASYGAVDRPYLSNVPGLRYHAIAEALGIPAEVVSVPLGGSPEEVDAGIARLSAVLAEAAAVDGPSMVELVLPSAPEVWAGIWLTQGFEQGTASVAAPVR
ncbi:thiamine pyrophosphate-binding protein [Plantactinospora sp. CA-290183]|uniref:thiamine pyrophosphate-binding protein n=1 Tax=Plantactinospora sp. CA-290183 TaxID=3240006 RepID=UPI003D8B2081